jgi:CubicO group peptidase (beta-lactamase class C family)
MTHRTAFLVVGLASSLIVVASLLIVQRVALGDPGPIQHPDPMQELSGDWPQPELRAGLSESQIAASIAAYAKRLADTDHFSGVVLAAKLGKVVVARAYGLADVASNTPNTIDTKFNIASIGKLFTKAAIGQLAEAGKLSLDDTVHKHLPELALAGADKITIRQLVDHQSGMGDLFGPKYFAAPPARLRELTDLVPLFADQPLEFEPGTAQRYSNAGYVVLGLIIERITGETYRDYLTKHVFAPAEMKSTGFWALEERVPDRAIGYTRKSTDGAPHGNDRAPGRRAPNTDVLSGRPSSAGGAFATAGDLLRFWQALLAGRVLSPRWTNWMINGSFDDARRLRGMSVNGATDGCNAAIEVSDGWTVIALANFDPPSASAVARGAMDIIRGRRPTGALQLLVEGNKPGPPRPAAPPVAPRNTKLGREVVVPTTMSRHLITVEAKLNGKGPFRFVVDTGSSAMLRITRAVQQTLQLEQLGEVMVGDPSGQHMAPHPVVRVASLEIGGARFSGIEATVGDQPGGDDLGGVIGLGLFANLTATLDYPGQQLRLSRLRKPGPHDR